MPGRNSNYFNRYVLLCRHLVLVISCFGLACNPQNIEKRSLSITNKDQVSESAININIASVEELKKLPSIGEQKARDIVDHREKFGRFRKTEHLLLVRGISDDLFRKTRNLLKVE